MENTKYFTDENTEGFSQSELDTMNKEMAEKMADVDENDFNYSDIEQNTAEKILNNH